MKSSFSRTFFTAVAVLLFALLLIGISFQILVKDYLTDTAVEGLKTDGQVIAELFQACFSDDLMSQEDFNTALHVAASVSGADAVICDSTGRLILCANEPMGCSHQGLVVSADFLEHVFTAGTCTDTGVIEGLYTDPRYVVSVPVFNTAGTEKLGIIIVSLPIAESAAVLKRISDIFLFVTLLVIVFALIVMIITSRQQSQPLRDMAQAASAFGHGDFDARVEVHGNYSQEMDELALAFNNMASSLQKSEYQRQEFVANVSHELKTPMTTIAGYVDGILDGTIPPEKSRHYLALVSDETKRLSRLVRSMLDISRLQDKVGIPEEQKLRFDLEEHLGQVLISFEGKITEKQLEVDVSMPDHPVYTLADPDAITQVIYNLIDNAVKFSPQGGTLSLTVREGGAKAYVSISNDGETIPAEQLPLLFDRFHKIDKSRSQNRDSWGLGLYIVKTLICSHGENISVTSRDQKTTFTFTLPVVH